MMRGAGTHVVLCVDNERDSKREIMFAVQKIYINRQMDGVLLLVCVPNSDYMYMG